MNRLVVTGSGVISAAGFGASAMTRALAAGVRLLPDIGTLYPDPMPYPAAHALVGFDARAELGRKGTSFLDRATALALVACGQAIENSALAIDEHSGERTGIALGTTVGSLRSSSEYSRETLVAERPYLVNPVLFPNTVMNCAAGQAAIRYGLKGVNSTVAGGRLGFLGALQYGVNALRRGYADTMLVGAVEELTPQTAWAHRALEFPGLPGEAAAVFVVEHEEAVLAAGRSPLAELVAVMGGFHPGGEPAGLAGRLTACIREVLTRSGLDTGQIGWVALSEAGGPADERIGTAAVAGALHPDGAEPIRVREVLGECGAASGALQFAALLERCRADPGRCGLMAGWMPDGAFGTAVVKGCADVGARRR